jgi:hypothetical protein
MTPYNLVKKFEKHGHNLFRNALKSSPDFNDKFVNYVQTPCIIFTPKKVLVKVSSLTKFVAKVTLKDDGLLRCYAVQSGYAMMKEAANTSKTSVNLYQTARKPGRQSSSSIFLYSLTLQH